MTSSEVTKVDDFWCWRKIHCKNSKRRRNLEADMVLSGCRLLKTNIENNSLERHWYYQTD